jgi:galactose mutarotase-like enzyme
LKIYPFKFEFNIKYALEENKLNVEHTIVNMGDKPMLFSLGGHPGFNCPVNADESYSDYFLEFQEAETAETWRVQKDGLIGKETVPVFDEPKIINLHSHLFDEDALIFKNLNSKKVSLKSRKSKQVLSMIFNDFPYLGIWAKPMADYVCIEPWIGIADSVDTDRNFENKEGMVLLGSKQSTTAVYTILIEE